MRRPSRKREGRRIVFFRRSALPSGRAVLPAWLRRFPEPASRGCQGAAVFPAACRPPGGAARLFFRRCRPCAGRRPGLHASQAPAVPARPGSKKTPRAEARGAEVPEKLYLVYAVT